MQIHAAIQATLHNTAGKTYKEQFTSDMFMPGYKRQPQSLEQKMTLLEGMMRREVRCPDCRERIKAREVHECHGR